MDKIRLLLVDDHAVIRSGLRMLLEAQDDMTIVGEADSGRMAIDKVRELRPGELAELMRQGQAEVLEDPQVPLVERALVSMMRRMRDDLGREPG